MNPVVKVPAGSEGSEVPVARCSNRWCLRSGPDATLEQPCSFQKELMKARVSRCWAGEMGLRMGLKIHAWPKN